jgi:hypothetical protein
VVALVEGGLHGSTAAAPVAREVIRVHFEKKNRRPVPALTARLGADSGGRTVP